MTQPRFSPASHTRMWEHLNALDDEIKDTGAMEYMNARLSAAAQSIPNTVVTTVLLTQDAQDASGSMTIANGIITVSKAGLYLVTGSATFVPNAVGVRNAYIMSGATTMQRASTPGNAQSATVWVTRIFRMAAGGTLNLSVWQASGAALNLEISNRQTAMDVVRIAS